MGLFSNRQQSIPERFIEKMRVDAEIAEVLKPKIVQFSDISALKAKLKPLREEQRAIWISCDNFIKDAKVNGPTA